MQNHIHRYNKILFLICISILFRTKYIDQLRMALDIPKLQKVFLPHIVIKIEQAISEFMLEKIYLGLQKAY